MRSVKIKTALVVLAAVATLGLGTATASASTHSKTARLTGRTTVTTAPGIAGTLLKAGILPLPAAHTRFGVGFSHGQLVASYGFPITSGNPNLTAGTGDILHSGGIHFVSRHASLSIGRFDIDLAAGKVFATRVNGAKARVAVLDLDLAKLTVSSRHGYTVLTGIVVRLDPAAAGAINATFGAALPTDGSLVFGSARVVVK